MSGKSISAALRDGVAATGMVHAAFHCSILLLHESYEMRES
jgi:hypothetical protein